MISYYQRVRRVVSSSETCTMGEQILSLILNKPVFPIIRKGFSRLKALGSVATTWVCIDAHILNRMFSSCTKSRSTSVGFQYAQSGEHVVAMDVFFLMQLVLVPSHWESVLHLVCLISAITISVDGKMFLFLNPCIHLCVLLFW